MEAPLKIIAILLIIISLVPTSMYPKSQILLKKPQFKLYVLDKGINNHFNLNPVIFHMAFMERLIFGLKINKLIKKRDIIQISHLIFCKNPMLNLQFIMPKVRRYKN